MNLDAAFDDLIRPSVVRPTSSSNILPLPINMPAEANDSYESLTVLFGELARKMGSDGMIVVLHRFASSPEILFETSDCLKFSDFKRQMLEFAVNTILTSRSPNSPHWSSPDNSGIANILTVQLVLSDSVFSVTALFSGRSANMRKQALEVATCFLPYIRAFLHLCYLIEVPTLAFLALPQPLITAMWERC